MTDKTINDGHFKQNSTDESGVVLFTTTPNHLNWRDIKKAYIEAGLGWVERVDLVPSGKYKKAFIYFEPYKWNMEDKQAEYDHLQTGGAIKVFYEGERYFNTRVSTQEKITKEEAVRRAPRVRVEISKE